MSTLRLKSLLLILSAGLFYTQSYGQIKIDRAVPPKPGPAPKINIGIPASFETPNGIKVFVVEDHKVPRVTVSLLLNREPLREYDKVGYVDMAGMLMRRGTKDMDKAALDKRIDFLGGNINTGSKSASGFSLTKNFDELFKIFSDVILHPSLKESELNKIKKETLSALDAEKNDPSAIMNNVVAKANYGPDYPYGEVETPETIGRIDREDIVSYYETYWRPNLAYMAFVGDITPEHARELVNQYLGDWERRKVAPLDYPIPQRPEETKVYLADRPSAVQTNINITFPVDLKPGDHHYFALSLMNQILGGGTDGWLFQDLREKHGYTYGAYSSVQSDPYVGNFSASAAVRTEVTDSSLDRFMALLNQIRDEKVSDAKLDSVKNVFTGNFALSLESPSRIAQFALNVARYHLPEDYYQTYLKKMNEVNTNEVQEVAQKYIIPDRFNIVLVGNSQAIGEGLEKYGKVVPVDIYGNRVVTQQ